MRWLPEPAGPSLLAALLAAAAIAATRPAAAGGADYGRIEGDTTWITGLGAVVAPGGLRAVVEMRLRYLESAGVFVAYEEGALLGSGADAARVLAGGFELKPVFLFRWLRGHETGAARLDLVLDSIGLELGTFLFQPVGHGFGSEAGLQAALGVELPLLERASGPWVALRGGLRWANQATSGSSLRDVTEASSFLTFTLAWHQIVTTHLVDSGDEAPR